MADELLILQEKPAAEYLIAAPLRPKPRPRKVLNA